MTVQSSSMESEDIHLLFQPRVKKGGDGSWTTGTANTEQKDIAETTGLDDAARLDRIRTIRQDGL